MIEKHDLLHEFPEHRDRIHQLKIGNNHFQKLFKEYNELDREIRKIEINNEAVSDFDLEDRKKKRLLLKDKLYHMIVYA